MPSLLTRRDGLAGRPALVGRAAALLEPVRATVVYALRNFAPDSPVTGQLLSAGRDDPDPEVRLEALARYGDALAYEQLRRLADEAGEHSHTRSLTYDVERHLRIADS